MTNVQRLRQSFSWVLCAVLSWQLAFAPALLLSPTPVSAAYRPAEGSAPIVASDLRRFESEATKEAVGRQMVRSETLWRAIQAGQTSQLSSSVLDPHLLVRQHILVETSDGRQERIHYSNPQAQIPSIQPSAIEFVIENGRFMAVAQRGERVLARLVFAGIDAVSFAANRDVVVILDRQGQLWALQRESLVHERRAFVAPAPAMKIYESGSLGRIDESFRLSFQTRGLDPRFLESESLRQSGIVYPQGKDGRVELQAENLFVYRESADERRLAGIFAAPHIYNQIRLGTLHLGRVIFQTNLFGQLPNADERLQRVLQVEGGGSERTPLEALVAEHLRVQESSAQAERLQALEARWQESLQSHPKVAAVLERFSRSGLAQIVEQARNAANLEDRPRDRFTLEQWANSFSQLVGQAERVLAEIDRELQRELTSEQRERFERERRQLSEALGRGDLHQVHRQLTQQWLNGGQPTFDFAESQRNWYQSYITRANLIRVAIIGASVAGVHFGLNFMDAIVSENYSVSQKTYLVVNWVYDMIPGVFKDAGYRKILIASYLTMLSLVPITEILTAAFSRPMKGIAQILKGRSGRAAELGERLYEAMEKLERLNVYQRLVTVSARAFSYIIPYFEYLSSLSGQNFIRSARAGVNPLTRVTGETELGRRIGLAPGESLRTGVNNPLRDTQLFNRWTFFFPFSITNPLGDTELRDRQNAAIEQLSLQQRRAQVLAWTVATLTVSEATRIDPATLSLLQSERVTMEQVAEIERNSQTREHWQRTARAMNAYFNALLTQGQIDFSEVRSEDIRRYYEKAMEVATRLQERQGTRSGRLLNSLTDLRNRFRLIGGPILTSVGNVGRSQADFLRNVLADQFVARRVELGIKSDIPVSNTIAATLGKRADLSQPEYLFAQANGFLFTNPQRWFEVVNNLYYAHLMSAASNKLLVFQSVRAETEKAYQPIESFLRATDRPESLAAGIVSWLQVFDFKNSNLGSYFTRTFQKRLALAYVVIPMTLLMRSGIGGQPVEMAAMAATIFYFAAVFSFAFPWTVLHRGSQMSTERVAAQRRQLEQKIQRIAELERRGGGASELATAYRELVELYRQSDRVAYQNLLRSLQGIEAWMEVRRDQRLLFSNEMKRQMRAIFTRGEVQILLDGLAQLNEAKERNDLSQARRIHQELAELLQAKRELPAFRELATEIERRATRLSAFAQTVPPVYTETHPGLERTLTFWGGAVLSSVLFLSLSVLTFTPEALTWANVGKWIGISVAGHAVIQYAFGKTGLGWRLVDPVVQRVNRLTEGISRRSELRWLGTERVNQIRVRTCRQAVQALSGP